MCVYYCWICKTYCLSCAMNTTIACGCKYESAKALQMNTLGRMKMTINSLFQGRQRMVLVTTGCASCCKRYVGTYTVRITFKYHISMLELMIISCGGLKLCSAPPFRRLQRSPYYRPTALPFLTVKIEDLCRW